MIMLLVLGVAAFGAAIFLVGEACAEPRREVKRSLERAARPDRAAPIVPELPPAEAPAWPRTQLTQRAATIALRLSPRTTLDGVAMRLASAGVSSRLRAYDFLALRFAFGAGGAALGMVIGVSRGSVLQAMLLVAL